MTESNVGPKGNVELALDGTLSIKVKNTEIPTLIENVLMCLYPFAVFLKDMTSATVVALFPHLIHVDAVLDSECTDAMQVWETLREDAPAHVADAFESEIHEVIMKICIYAIESIPEIIDQDFHEIAKAQLSPEALLSED